jgi:quercetin dioxygenase-like cupin family protein
MTKLNGSVRNSLETRKSVRSTGALVGVALLLGVAASTLPFRRAMAAPEPRVTTLLTKELANIPGKEGMMLTVVYPPGGADPVHRHNAHAFLYVLEGSIVMAVNGGKEVTLNPGQTFYEGLNDVHTVGRNASTTKPAKFLVVLIKDQGVPAVLPVG